MKKPAYVRVRILQCHDNALLFLIEYFGNELGTRDTTWFPGASMHYNFASDDLSSGEGCVTLRFNLRDRRFNQSLGNLPNPCFGDQSF